MALFKKFKRTTPRGLLPNGPTVQGVYCMTADGQYLSGYFAFARRDKAKSVVEQGLRRFTQLARKRGYKSKAVPTNKLDFTLGNATPRGGMKLEVAIRDLPRGSDRRPGRGSGQRDAYNVSWLTYTPAEAARFVTNRRKRQRLPNAMLEKMAKTTLKDAVRGQCANWKKGALKDGALFTELIQSDGDQLTLRITGYAKLSQSGRGYDCRLHGKMKYDSRRKQFTSVELVAAGQRSGRSQFNSRQKDHGPAPMGVAYVLHASSRAK